MDLDYLMRREQVERRCADTAASPGARALHGQLADMFRDRIDFRRRVLLTEAGIGPALTRLRL